MNRKLFQFGTKRLLLAVGLITVLVLLAGKIYSARMASQWLDAAGASVIYLEASKQTAWQRANGLVGNSWPNVSKLRGDSEQMTPENLDRLLHQECSRFSNLFQIKLRGGGIDDRHLQSVGSP